MPPTSSSADASSRAADAAVSHRDVGGFRVTWVREGIYRWDGGAMFGVVPKTLWGRHFAADASNCIALAFNCCVIETGEHTILVDTGGGDKMEPRARERLRLAPPRPLPEIIAENGIDPEKIDIVLNTHLHWDHCGWNTIRRSSGAVPAFPRATYYTRRQEWEHAHERHPRDAVSYIDDNYDPLVGSGQMQLIDDDREVAPGVWMRHAPGHNRDMMIVTAASSGRTFCFFSDLIPTTAHIKPTWVAAFDLYPLEAIDQKSRWLARAAGEKWICGFGHDPDTDFVEISEQQGAFQVRK